MNRRQLLDQICMIYHSEIIDESDQHVLALAFALLGIWPIAEIPQKFSDSIHAFRGLSNVERYSFALTEIAGLIDFKCKNAKLQKLFKETKLYNSELLDARGQPALRKGQLFLPSGQKVDFCSSIFAI